MNSQQGSFTGNKSIYWGFPTNAEFSVADQKKERKEGRKKKKKKEENNYVQNCPNCPAQCKHTHTHTHTHTLQPIILPHAPILLIFLHLKIIGKEFIHLGEFQALHLCSVQMKWDPDFSNCAVLQIKHKGRTSLSGDMVLSFSCCLLFLSNFRLVWKVS